MAHPHALATVTGRRHEGVYQLLLAGVAALAYFGVRNLTVGSAPTAYANARRLMDFEHAVRIDWEPALQAPALESSFLLTLANWVYIWGHWPVILTVAVLLFRHRRDRYLLLRNTMLVSAAIGFVFFAAFPVAPPRLADPALQDTVTLHSNAYRALQPPGLTNQYAAFPSLHFGWNVLVGIALWGVAGKPLLRVFAVAGPLAMGLAVVMTANHFVVDVAAGLAVVLVALLFVRRLSA